MISRGAWPTSTILWFCDSTSTCFKVRLNLSLELGRLLPFLFLQLPSPTLDFHINAAVCPDSDYFPLLSHWIQRELDHVLKDIMLRCQGCPLSPLRKSVGMRYLVHLWISVNSATFLKTFLTFLSIHISGPDSFLTNQILLWIRIHPLCGSAALVTAFIPFTAFPFSVLSVVAKVIFLKTSVLQAPVKCITLSPVFPL